jgi:hypothetical protein
MPEYVIEREVPGAGNLSEEEIREVSLRSLAVLNELGSSIRWLHSYVTNEKIYWAANRIACQPGFGRTKTAESRQVSVAGCLLVRSHIFQQLAGGHGTALCPYRGLLSF